MTLWVIFLLFIVPMFISVLAVTIPDHSWGERRSIRNRWKG